ncbi:MAG: efflux RND transporter periplasmic adaptor subunit [Leptolyngbyaceae bacterium]|nr:efflux RND transporter periplasmic adaptor subunit [Leptolyngbyaceae bacterium]
MQVPILGKVKRPVPWIIGIVAVGVIGGGLATTVAVRRHQQTNYAVEEFTIPVESQPLEVRITASGSVESAETVNLSPRNSDVLVDLLVEQGDRVVQGQVIARMKSDDVEAEVARARAQVQQAEARLAELRAGNRTEEIDQAIAQVAQAEASVSDAEARLSLAQDRLQRNESLEQEGAISQNELNDYINERDRAQATVRQQQQVLQEAEYRLELLRNGSRVEDIAEAEAQVREAIANLRSTEVRLEDTYIRAPFDGIISQKYATEGAFVTPTTSASEASSATSSAIVAISSGVEVIAEVPEVDISRIYANQAVEITADAYPDEVFEGRVKRIAPQAIVDPSRGDFVYFEVTIEVLTGLDQLRSGMQTDVTFIGDELQNALVVPTVAIVSQDGQQGVLVPDDNNRARFRRVTIGPQVGNQIQILEGVDAGDRIFVELPPGQTLENLNFGRNSEDDE